MVRAAAADLICIRKYRVPLAFVNAPDCSHFLMTISFSALLLGSLLKWAMRCLLFWLRNWHEQYARRWSKDSELQAGEAADGGGEGVWLLQKGAVAAVLEHLQVCVRQAGR